MKFATTVRLFGAASVASLLLAPVAQADSGFYLGASIADSSVDISVAGFEESDTAWKGFVGYIFDMPVVDFAIEAAYVDFGAPSNPLIETDADGISATGLVGIDWGLFGIFGKAGFVSWDGELNSFQGDLSGSGTDPVYGVGFRFNFSSLEIRAEYEVFALEDDFLDVDIDMASVGLVWRF